MTTSSRTLRSAVAALALLLPALAVAAPATAAPRSPVVYDALGDSYGSGYGVPPYLDGCGRSAAAYAVQIDGRMRIDLDDFGTGYSSLSYLHRLPIDRVKIDRSFIASINEQSDSLEIVRAIIGLSRNLGMEVVAEGIEREAQATTLRALGCELAQGFFFSPPLVAREAEGYLRAARR